MNFLCFCLCTCLIYVEHVALHCFNNDVNIPPEQFALNLDDFDEFVVGQNMFERYRGEPFALPHACPSDVSIFNSNIHHTKVSEGVYTQALHYNIDNPVDPGIFCIRKQANFKHDHPQCNAAVFIAEFAGDVRTKTVYWSSNPSQYVLMMTCVGFGFDYIRTCPRERTVISVLLPKAAADAPFGDIMSSNIASISNDLGLAKGIPFEAVDFKWSEVSFGETQTAVRYYSPYRAGAVNYPEHDLDADGIKVDDTTSLLFQTKGKCDAHILLQEDCTDYHNDIIEVVIGGWDNTKSVIRSAQQQNPPKDEYQSTILSTAMFQWFWISWVDGHVKVGRGNTVGDDMFMDWDGFTHDINCARISYGFGSDGEWIFYKPGFCDEDNPGDVDM